MSLLEFWQQSNRRPEAGCKFGDLTLLCPLAGSLTHNHLDLGSLKGPLCLCLADNAQSVLLI